MALGLGFPLTSSTCAKLMAIIAVAPTIEPEDRSMPPEMITWVTPSAMIPMIATCRMMIFRRCSLKMESNRSLLSNRKLWPMISAPRPSKINTIRISAPRMFTSFGH